MSYAFNNAPGGANPNAFLSWLAGLAPQARDSILRNMNFVGSANASALPNATPVPPQLAGGGPQVQPGMIPPIRPAPTPIDPRLAGGGPQVQPGMIPPIPVAARTPIAPGSMMAGGGVNPNYIPAAPGGGFGVNPQAPRPIQPVAQGPVAQGNANPAVPKGSATPAAASRFANIAAPNQDFAGGALSQQGGPRMMSALDLSQLFGRTS